MQNQQSSTSIKTKSNLGNNLEPEKRRSPCVLISAYGTELETNSSTSEDLPTSDMESSTRLFSRIPAKPPTTRLNTSRWLMRLSQIRGPSGSVRGHKDVVRKSLENIDSHPTGQRRFSSMELCKSFSGLKPTLEQLEKFYRLERLSRFVEEERDQCVLYTTTLGVVRRTFEDSRRLRSILDLNLIRYQERDIYLNQEYRDQLRLRREPFQVPSIFVDGHYMGALKEVELMNENGCLTLTLAKFKMPRMEKNLCRCCGNARFIACQSCNGSRKSTIHHFKFNSVALRCIRCDRNSGLVQCHVCQSEIHLKVEESITLIDANNNNDCHSSSSQA